MNLALTGHEGTVRWGYRRAVTFGACRYEGTGTGGTLTAQITSCDEFAMQQSPLIAIVPMGRAVWRWIVRDLRIEGSTLTATVEPHEG
jgi:hypothetical protein